MQWLLIPLVVVAGALNAVQAGSNQTLNKRLDHPFVSAMLVYAGGVLVTSVAWVVVRLATGKGLPPASAFAEVPWWGFIGGTMGAIYVLAMLTAAAKLGAGVFTAATVTAGTVTALVLDHFGWMGFEPHAAGLGRIAGGALMIAGLVLIAKF